MQTIKIKDIKKGEFFTLKEIENPTEAQVYIKGDYDRAERKYECAKFSDVWGNGRMFKGDKVVYIGFTF